MPMLLFFQRFKALSVNFHLASFSLGLVPRRSPSSGGFFPMSLKILGASCRLVVGMKVKEDNSFRIVIDKRIVRAFDRLPEKFYYQRTV
jgi:hypothetical protein